MVLYFIFTFVLTFYLCWIEFRINASLCFLDPV